MYNKLFTKILDSSIWLEDSPTRIVWLTFIAVMDEKGFAPFAAVGNVANRARVTLDEAKAAIAVLEAPDAESSDPENEGRRLERVPGGWMVLNAEKHRNLITRAVRQAQTAERVRRYRERLKRNSNAPVTPSEALALALSDEKAQEQKIKAAPAARKPSAERRDEDRNVRIITKIAHEVLNSNGHIANADAMEAIKTLCAKRKIAYDSEAVRKALDSAEAQSA